MEDDGVSCVDAIRSGQAMPLSQPVTSCVKPVSCFEIRTVTVNVRAFTSLRAACKDVFLGSLGRLSSCRSKSFHRYAGCRGSGDDGDGEDDDHCSDIVVRLISEAK